MSRVCCSLHLFAAAQRSMSVYGEQDLLLKLQDSLLQTGDAGKNTRCHAFFWTEDDNLSSCDRHSTCHGNLERTCSTETDRIADSSVPEWNRKKRDRRNNIAIFKGWRFNETTQADCHGCARRTASRSLCPAA